MYRIRDYQALRGPDAKGEWFSGDGHVALGHRRLAIIDLDSTSNQPMRSADDRLVIVFNGEIYNYQELRARLIAQGYRFKTGSDTEVLINCYAKWGTQMFSQLRGMYAFAIWDSAERKMLLARDPYGIKPLYFSNDGTKIRFASQVKAILAGGAVSAAPDAAGIAGFLMMGSVPEPYTTHRAIRSLPAGHHVIVDENGVGDAVAHFSVQNIWREAAENPVCLTAESHQKVVSDALRDSVRQHLVADVPIAAFLSAGIDSGAIVGLMKEAGAADIQGITLGFKEFQGQHNDETPLANELADRYNCRHQICWIEDEQVGRDLPRILKAMDQPSVDGVNTWLVSKAASEAGLKVVLSGVGGDELFGGYSHFEQLPRWAARIRRLNRVPGMTRIFQSLGRVASHWHLVSEKAAGLMAYGSSLPGLYFVKRGLFMPWELPSILGDDFAKAGLAELNPPEFIRSALGQESQNSFATIASLEAVFYLRNQLLRDSDWASMDHSLELRTPLIDAQLLTRLAPYLIGRPRSATGKISLAKSPTPELPNTVIHRRKTGFSLPMGRWIEASKELDHWRRQPELNSDNCHWSRRMAYSLASELLNQ